MRGTENPENVVRLHEAPLEKRIQEHARFRLWWQFLYMELVAQLAERQVVALVVVGSIPIKLPNAPTAQKLAKVTHRHCNEHGVTPQKQGFTSGSFA